MHTPVVAALLVASLIGAAPAMAAPAAATKLVPAGAPVNCITASSIRTTRVIDENTVDFTLNGNKIFRNHLPNGCPGLNFDRAFAYAPTTNQLCSVDTITVIQQGGGPMRGATCGLGPFTPMKPDKGGGK